MKNEEELYDFIDDYLKSPGRPKASLDPEIKEALAHQKLIKDVVQTHRLLSVSTTLYAIDRSSKFKKWTALSVLLLLLGGLGIWGLVNYDKDAKVSTKEETPVLKPSFCTVPPFSLPAYSEARDKYSPRKASPMSTPLMKAIQVHAYGGPDQLVLEEVPRPIPQTDEILVRVYAAGVLPMETAVRQGMYPGIMPKSFPYTPGTAFAGVVEEVGPGVTNFYKGQAICGRAPTGTYAEYVVINVNPPAYVPGQDRARLTAAVIPLADKPKSLSFDQAATLSGGATTAWTSIFDDGQVQAGQRVLIHGAAGGVGLFAVQFAKWKGAEVFATTSTNNVAYVRSIGADTVIDYRTTRFEDVVRDVDFVLDTIGGDSQRRSMLIVRPGGTLISVYEVPPADLAVELGIRATMNQTLPNSQHLRQIVQLIDEGCATPAIRQIFPLSEANKAHALSETGHGRGRIILHVAD